MLKSQVEEYADMKLKSDDVLTLWMLRWAAMMCSRYAVGRDGKTAYERRRGRRCNILVVPFGEKVWFKQIRDQKERKDKFDSEWREGIWLGHSRNSNEVLVGTKDGVVRAYAIRRQEGGKRWSKELIEQLRGTPQQPDPKKPGLAIPVRVNFEDYVEEETEEVKEREFEPRRMKITKQMCEDVGYTEGCEGCRTQKAGMTVAVSYTHLTLPTNRCV